MSISLSNCLKAAFLWSGLLLWNQESLAGYSPTWDEDRTDNRQAVPHTASLQVSDGEKDAEKARSMQIIVDSIKHLENLQYLDLSSNFIGAN